MKKHAFLIGTLLLASALTNAASATPITSTFDDGVEGWFISSGGVLNHRANGGNPGGHIVSTDTRAPQTSDLTLLAPAAFRGDLSRFDGGTISVDFTQVSAGSTEPFFERFGRIQIGNNQANLQTSATAADLVPGSTPIPTSGFQTYTTEFSAAGFGFSQQDWETLIGNVTEIAINIETHRGADNERVGIDNFSISGGQAPIDNFVFAGGCGNNNWHDTSCAATNWIGDAGQPVSAPPGDAPGGDENATIVDTTVRVEERDVALNSLSATGQLELRANMSLGSESTIENLVMGEDVTLATAGDLSLTGEGELRGNLQTGEGGLIFNDGRYTSSGNVLLEGRFLNGDTVNQSGFISLFGNIDNAGDWTLRNDAIVGGTFNNLDTLLVVGESNVLAEYQGQDGSKIKTDSASSQLLLGNGGTFHGTTEINTQRNDSTNEDAKVVLQGVQEDKAVFRVAGVFDEGDSPSLLTVRPEEGIGGRLEIGAFSALHVEEGSRLSIQESVLELNGGDLTGRTDVGDFQNTFASSLIFTAGQLGVSDEQAMRAAVIIDRVGTMSIRGKAEDTRSLFGDITLEGNLLQSALLDMQDSNVTIRDGGAWLISDGGLQSDALSTITLEAPPANRIFNFATLALTEPATPDLIVNFAGLLDNNGLVFVREGTLNFTGNVTQVVGDVLQGGFWAAQDGGKLQIGTGTISTIGEGTRILLTDGGEITNLELAANNGDVQLLAVNMTTGALVNNGKLETRQIAPGAAPKTLNLLGSFTNNKELLIGSNTTVRTTDYITTANSKTTVNGRLEITQVNSVFRGSYFGFGVVQALQIEMRAADIEGGSSPGILTFDTPLFIADEDTVFHIEIGGTEAGTGYDLLLFTGDVILNGTLSFEFIDGFLPEADDFFAFFQAAGTITGQFTDILVSGLGDDVQFDVAFDPQFGGFVLSDVVAGTSAVPEPPALFLFAIGSLLLVTVRRRRGSAAS